MHRGTLVLTLALALVLPGTLAADTFEPNDTSGTAAGPFACGFSTTVPEISPLGDVDWFELTGTPGEVMTIDIDAKLLGSTLDAQIQAHDSGLTPIGFSDDNQAPGEPFTLDSFVQVIIPADGIVPRCSPGFPTIFDTACAACSARPRSVRW